MSDARPHPVVGVFLGLLLGLGVVSLLWVTGALPPDRLVLFGILALALALASWAAIQKWSASKPGAITATVLVSVLAGVALTGIPEFTRGGSLSDGCTFSVTASDGTTVTPADTSATAPFDVAPGDMIPWSGDTDGVPLGESATAGLVIGGFTLPLWNGTDINTDETATWGGTVDVAALLDDVTGSSGIELTGTFHVSGGLSAGNAECTGDGYVRVAPAGAFATGLLWGLWIITLLAFAGLVWVAVAVRKSFATEADDDGTSSDSKPSDDTPQQ